MDYPIVSTPFLPNGSRYPSAKADLFHLLVLTFQHLFFLTEVATRNLLKDLAGLITPAAVFQHLFFLTEVATSLSL